MSVIDKPVIAIVLSLVGGILIFIGGLFRTLFGFFANSVIDRFGSMAEFMAGNGQSGQMMGNQWTIVFGIIGVVSGLIVAIGAGMLDYQPKVSKTWAILILAFSIIGILGGSFSRLYIGSVLGIIGGILAFLWRPQASQKQ